MHSNALCCLTPRIQRDEGPPDPLRVVRRIVPGVDNSTRAWKAPEVWRPNAPIAALLARDDVMVVVGHRLTL